MEWRELHIKLAQILGDPRDESRILLENPAVQAEDTDGQRYTSAYRSRLLNAGIRWVLTAFDPVYLMQNGIPLGNSAGDLIVNENFENWGQLSKRVQRLLSIVDTTNNHSIPIITPTTKRLRIFNNSHWDSVPCGYLIGNNTIAMVNDNKGGTYTAYYIREFDDYTFDCDIGLPKMMHDYIIMYAVYFNKLNSQRFQEGAILKQQTDADMAKVVQTMELTKQLAYNK